MKTTYKIRRKSDGLYSNGGETPKFTKQGKAWGSLMALKLHIGQFFYHWEGWTRSREPMNVKRVYDGCEIVAFTEQEAKDIMKFIAEEEMK